MNNMFCCWFLPSLMSIFPFLIYIVKPVNNVEERKDSWEDHPRPFVDRVYISQVWDGDLQLRSTSSQTALLLSHVTLQGVSTEVVSGQPCFAVLQRRAVVRQHRIPWVIEAQSQLRNTHVILDVEGAQQDVFMWVNLSKEKSQRFSVCWLS